MKSRDVGIVGIAVILAVILSVVISKFVFVNHSSGQKVELVPLVSSSFSQPDSRYFNSTSIDLTQFISIGNNSNPNPFQQSSSSTP
ncbi:MAG: hypothetical protein ACREF7_02395 [Candidatus Saccharimonadales bacterium]